MILNSYQWEQLRRQYYAECCSKGEATSFSFDDWLNKDYIEPILLNDRARFKRFYGVRQEPTIQKTGNRRERKVIHRKINLKGLKR